MLCYVLILWFCFGSNKMHLSPPGKIPLQHRSLLALVTQSHLWGV